MSCAFDATHVSHLSETRPSQSALMVSVDTTLVAIHQLFLRTGASCLQVLRPGGQWVGYVRKPDFIRSIGGCAS